MVTDTLFRAPPKSEDNISRDQHTTSSQSNNNYQQSQSSFPNMYTTTTEPFPADTRSNTATATQSATATTTPIKKDITCIPPAFFVGSQEPEDANEIKLDMTRSVSIGYGDRRLSRVIPEPTSAAEAKEVKEPPRTTVAEFVDPNRGLFGDGIVQKKRRVPATNDHFDNSKKTEYSTCTIRVFGYPLNLTHNIINHFSRYGTIRDYEQSASGNWISITYASDLSAVAALKSNGTIISKNHLIGVCLEPESEQQNDSNRNSSGINTSTTSTTDTSLKGDSKTEDKESHSIMKIQEGINLYKTDLKKANGQYTLGSGKVGISAKKSKSLTNDLLGKMKEYVFGW
ncbi:hypothetical protein BDF20DRAFT_909937 [Mycotypha africana]|uniref:uncharacterized protein n=1 Tax=Mycotypha africana TaxID=64632 RepID=UPI002301DB58|nr:uncharacterized protein BDF20DRAFT_909937 [Mycotypha africana]KAI8987298.1 hypothetical protein BDF20DRAFT_909937 [Mycotypha africana]